MGKSGRKVVEVYDGLRMFEGGLVGLNLEVSIVMGVPEKLVGLFYGNSH